MYTILIIEDDRETLDILDGCLADAYEIHCTTSGIKAVAELKRKPPDLILMALNLPGVEGMDFIQQLRQHPQGQNIPIILMKEQIDKNFIELGLRHGANDFIIKPVGPEVVRSKVRYQLESAGRIEQRRTRRYFVRWRMDYQRLGAEKVLSPSQGQQTITLNISQGGVAFLALPGISSKNLCAFAVYPSGEERPSLVVGQVVWVKSVKGKAVAGARWLGWESQDEKAAVMKAVRSHQKSETQIFDSHDRELVDLE